MARLMIWDAFRQAAEESDGSLDDPGRFPRLVSTHEIRVQSRDPESRIIGFPIIRETMERHVDLDKLFVAEDRAQDGRHLPSEGAKEGALVGRTQFREDDPERGMLSMPTGDVRLPDR